MASQKTTPLLADIGSEEAANGFFSELLPWLGGSKGATSLLIDGPALPGGSRFPMAAVSSPDGDERSEVRLAYATQLETGSPMCFNLGPENAGDASLASDLTRAAAKLKAGKANASLAILDADYRVEKSFQELRAKMAPFAMRLEESGKLGQSLVEKHVPGIGEREGIAGFNGRRRHEQAP